MSGTLPTVAGSMDNKGLNMYLRFTYSGILIFTLALVSATRADEIKNFIESPNTLRPISQPLPPVERTKEVKSIVPINNSQEDKTSPSTNLEKSLMRDFEKALTEEKKRPVKPMIDNTMEIDRRERDCKQRNEANRGSCYSRCSNLQMDNGRYEGCLAACQGYQEYNCR